jgi:hypothetical protein
MLHSLWKYLESLQPWKQFSILVAFLLSLGFSFKEIVTSLKHWYHDRSERRKDVELLNYLFSECEHTKPEYDRNSRPLNPQYRSTIEAATALGRSSVEIYHRLCRLEMVQRVDRLSPDQDFWSITTLERHDAKNRKPRGR